MNKLSFKNKVLIPIIIVFFISVLIISINNYKLLDSAVKIKTDTNLDIFIDNIFAQIKHLDMIHETTEEMLHKHTWR
jgi:uncharacterized membrane protein